MKTMASKTTASKTTASKTTLVSTTPPHGRRRTMAAAGLSALAILGRELAGHEA